MLAAEFKAREDPTWILKQATSMLNLMWGGDAKLNRNIPQQSDWRVCKRRVALGEIDWTPALQEMFLLVAAMVNCEVPLSAAMWAKERFIPVLIKNRKFEVLGLLAVHAADGLQSGQPDTSEARSIPMLSVGHHVSGPSIGRDLTLAHPEKKTPVGLIPDFLKAHRSDETYVERVEALYDGLPIEVGPRGALLTIVPLDAVSMSVSPDGSQGHLRDGSVNE
jgi:hypothetical protein